MQTSNSDFLTEIKNKILEEKKSLEYRISQLKSQDPFSDKERLIDNAASDQEASEESGHDRLAALITTSQSRLTDVISALSRLDSGSYGVCTSCGQPIEQNRLKALPTATLCMSCEEKKA